MRRPMLLAVLLGGALILVIYSQFRLNKAIEEGKFAEEPASESVPTEIPVEEEAPATVESPEAAQANPEAPVAPLPEEKAPAAVETGTSAKEKVLAALMETRVSFRTREKLKAEVKSDPHRTPPSIVGAAGKLADLQAMEAQFPEQKADFQEFYLECARDAKVITVTRVQCVEKYFLSKGSSPEEKAQILEALPPIVKRLYNELNQG